MHFSIFVYVFVAAGVRVYICKTNYYNSQPDITVLNQYDYSCFSVIIA